MKNKFNPIYYIVYWIVLISGQTYFVYYPDNELWLNVLYNTSGLFFGLGEYLVYLVYMISYGYESFDPKLISNVIVWGILPIIPIFVLGIRNFSPPYSTFIRFYFVSNIMASILWLLVGYYYSQSYGESSDLAWFGIRIPILILHLNIILSKNPIVKGIDNLAIKFKLPSSSGSSSLGDDLD